MNIKNSAIIVSLLLILGACKEYKVVEPKSLPESVQKLWLLKSITVTENGLPADNVTVYNGFTIEFVGSKYYVSNGNDAFPTTIGNWGFNDPNFTSIEFDGGIKAGVTRFNASELNFTFTRKGGSINGRIPERTFTLELIAFK